MDDGRRVQQARFARRVLDQRTEGPSLRGPQLELHREPLHQRRVSCIPDAHPVNLYLFTAGVQGRSPWSSRRLSFGDANADVRTRPFTERLRDR